MSKYHAKKIMNDEGTFDSKEEYGRWCELKLLEKAGKINDLRRQVKFPLIPAQYKDGKMVERACNYVADFQYYEPDPSHPLGLKLVVEDTKGVRTKEYLIKRKLMLSEWGIQIRET